MRSSAAVSSVLLTRDGLTATIEKTRDARRVAVDSPLHRQATVEDDREQLLERHDLADSAKRRVLTERVTGEECVIGDQALVLQIQELCVLHYGECWLGKFCGEEQALLVLEGV